MQCWRRAVIAQLLTFCAYYNIRKYFINNMHITVRVMISSKWLRSVAICSSCFCINMSVRATKQRRRKRRRIKNTTVFHTSPVDVVEMDNIVDFSGLSSDYEKLYESGKYTDVSIHVGREPNSKIFLAHTLVLCTRSTFLENSLTKDTGEGSQKAAVTFEDMAPDIFEVLLR